MDTIYYQKRVNGNTQIDNVAISNQSDTTHLVNNESNFSFYNAINIVQLNPQTITNLSIKTIDSSRSFCQKFKILRLFIPKISIL